MLLFCHRLASPLWVAELYLPDSLVNFSDPFFFLDKVALEFLAKLSSDSNLHNLTANSRMPVFENKRLNLHDIWRWFLKESYLYEAYQRSFLILPPRLYFNQESPRIAIFSQLLILICFACKRMWSFRGFFLASNDLQRVKYLHPVSILIKIGVLVRKKKNAPKMSACENSRFSSLLAAGDVHYKPQARFLGDSDV